MNSFVNSLEDGPVGPKHVEIRQYINKTEIVTSVGFYSINFKDVCRNVPSDLNILVKNRPIDWQVYNFKK